MAEPDKDIFELLEDIQANAERARIVLQNQKQKEMSKEEFLVKLSRCQNFRAQLFGDFRVFRLIEPKLDMDALYKEYIDMKFERIGILSQFVKDNFLYISEKIGNRTRVTFREYDYNIIGDHNFPMSESPEPLPVNEDELSYFEVTTCSGCYTFRKTPRVLGRYLSVVKLYSIKKDVFLLNDEVIVHVQDSDISFNTEDEEKILVDIMESADALGGCKMDEIIKAFVERKTPK